MSTSDRDGPTMSVIICTKDREALLARLLRALDAQTRAPDEVVVVDASATPADEKTLATRAPLTYLHRSAQSGLTQARNTGVAAARHDVCVFLDDDVVPRTTLLERLARCYQERPDAGGVGAMPIEPRPPRRARVFFIELFQRGPFFHPVGTLQRSRRARELPVVRLSGAAMSFRRELVLAEPFDEGLRGYCLGEDMDASWRIAQRRPLLLLEGERVLHDNLGWKAEELGARFEKKVYTYSYHYLKNLRGARGAAPRYAWLMLGIYGEAVFHSLVHRTAAPVLGVRHARLRVRSGDLTGAGGFIARDPRKRDDASRAEPARGDRVA